MEKHADFKDLLNATVMLFQATKSPRSTWKPQIPSKTVPLRYSGVVPYTKGLELLTDYHFTLSIFHGEWQTPLSHEANESVRVFKYINEEKLLTSIFWTFKIISIIRSFYVPEILFGISWVHAFGNHKHNLKCIQQQLSKLHLIKKQLSALPICFCEVNSIAKMHWRIMKHILPTMLLLEIAHLLNSIKIHIKSLGCSIKMANSYPSCRYAVFSHVV